MSVTTPADLTTANWTGDTEETHLTNDLAAQPGYPCRTEDGQIVLIVKEEYPDPTRATKILVDGQGNRYAEGLHGVLVPIGTAEPGPDEADSDAREEPPVAPAAPWAA